MKPHSSKLKTALMSSSTVIGVLLDIIWTNIPQWFEFSLVGLATGVLLFTVTRHHIPFGRKGEIKYFSAGFISFALLIVLSWYI